MGILADSYRRGRAKNAAKAAASKVDQASIAVKTYKSDKDFERDAVKMTAQGWRVEAQNSGRGKVNVGRTVGKAVLLPPLALMRPSRKSDPITVTWVRDISSGS